MKKINLCFVFDYLGFPFIFFFYLRSVPMILQKAVKGIGICSLGILKFN